MSKRQEPLEKSSEQTIDRIPFSLKEEKDIASMATWMRITGIGTIAVGIIQIVMIFISKAHQQFIGAVLSILLGAWLFQAGTSFFKVATTDDADQMHLAQGFDRLRQVFLFKAVLVLIIIALAIVGFAAAVLLELAKK